MMNERIQITGKKYLTDDVLFLNGITRAGKFLLGKVVSSFERIEYFQYISLLEHLPFLVRLGFVKEDAAVELMRVNVDEHTYNSVIGRNLNFRLTDASSLYNTPEFGDYLIRSLSADIPSLLDSFRRERRLPCFIIHESLQDIKLFYKAFPAIKIIDLNRHPVDLVFSWYKRGWGHRQGNDPLSFAPVFRGHKGALPWYATSWGEGYDEMSEADRVIMSIATLIRMGNEIYAKLDDSEKQKMIRVTYEELVENTTKVVEMLSLFLDMPLKDSLPIVMARENIPHHLPNDGRKIKFAEIEKVASKDKLEVLSDMVRRYESEFFK